MSSNDEGIILEITQVGHSMEVRAVAPDGLEVAFVAPAEASEAELAALGRAKLEYVRRRADRTGPTAKPASDGRGGIVA